MKETIRIVATSFQASVEIAFGLTFKLAAPYSDNYVTLRVNPNITNFEAQPSSNVRKVSISKPIPESQTLFFDLDSQKSHRIDYEGGRLGVEAAILKCG